VQGSARITAGNTNIDQIFLLDNGSTMAEHWPMARNLVSVLAALLYEQDDNGMDLYFTSTTKKCGTFGEPQAFANAINEMRPRTDSSPEIRTQLTAKDSTKADDIRFTLSHILDLIGESGYRRKTTLLILTDGVWKGISRKRTVADKITNQMQQWADRGTMKSLVFNRGLSIQFIQFGDDDEATAEFDYLDNRLADSEGNLLP
jgi:hypothetical protein